ncbi:MAG: DegT/DnrJ/EryC1/StrS family aminotransferase [Sulfurospirillaceae bacterium]|nr:DegT/DnrJ/EryC1/StrS family aminotransferase [Sulfurospirillaceae bacterium]
MKEIPFYKPSIDIKEKTYVNEVLELSKTQMARALEKKFTEYVGSKNAISTNNGTSAMHLAMCALDLKRGDKIICSVNSFPSVAEVIRHFDAEPVFVDIDEDDFNIDLDSLEIMLEKNRSKKLKGAFINHIAGQATDLDRLYKIAKLYNINIIEDASDAMGATYNGKKIGGLKADIVTFRFSPQMKHALASGGILATNNENLKDRASLLRNHAIINDGWDDHGNLGYVYDVVDIGLKYDLNELNAAFALAQLEKNDEFIKRRKQIAAIYNEELKDCPHVNLPVKKGDHIYSQYIIKVDKNRDSFARDLKDRGINTALHYIPIHLLSYYKHKYSIKVNDFPKALSNYQKILSLPIYHGLKDNDVYYICEQIKDISKTRV